MTASKWIAVEVMAELSAPLPNWFWINPSLLVNAMPDHLHRLLVSAEVYDASDIHLTRDEPPFLRIGGRVVSTQDQVLTEAEIEGMMADTVTDAQRERFTARGYLDYAYETTITHEGTEKLVRYRMHLYRSRGAMTAAMRRIKLDIPSFEALYLPPAHEKAIAFRPKGIIIVGGETGSGKSTTLACMIDYLNERLEKHIVTIEDPIEYVLPNKTCKINQRELGQDFESFPDALRAVVRQDPDIILIGELRDAETVRAAIAAAETGHLVLTSLHTATATETIHRILYFFPPHEEHGVRQALANTLVALLNQMLLPTLPEAREKGVPKRVPATECLLNTPVVREMLRDSKHDQDLADLINSPTSSTVDGMHDFNFSLKRLFELGYIGLDTALGASLRPEQLKMALRGIS